MRSIKNAFFISLFVFLAACSSSDDKQFLKWGSYAWQIQTHTSPSIDTIYSINPKTLEEEVRIENNLDTLWSFTDTSVFYYDLGKTYADTVMQINPVTLEEQVFVETYSKLPYQVDAGKITLEDFHKLLQDSIYFPPSAGNRICDAELEIFSSQKHEMHWWKFIEKSNFKSLDLERGNRVIVFLHSCQEGWFPNNKVRGRILFEII